MVRPLLAILAFLLFIAILIMLPYWLAPFAQEALNTYDSSPARLATRNTERGLHPPYVLTAEAYQTYTAIHGTPTRPPTRTPAR